MRHGVEHHAERPQRTGEPIRVQRRIAKRVDPRKVRPLARADAHLCPQRRQIVRQHLSDATEAEHQARRAVQCDARVLHGELDGPLRRRNGVAHAELLSKIVCHMQPQRLRERRGVPAHIARENTVLGPQRAQQALHRELRTAQAAVFLRRQRQNDDLRSQRVAQRAFIRRAAQLPRADVVSLRRHHPGKQAHSRVAAQECYRPVHLIPPFP